MTEETTTEQLVEIEGQTTEYTPPEGWRLLAVGELVMLDDQWVRQDGSVWRSMGTEGPVSEGARYIRRIKPEPQVEPEPQPQPQQYTPPDGWRVLAVGERLRDGDVWVNHKGESRPTKRVGERVNDERYIRPTEPEPESQPEPQHNGLVRDVTHLLQESGVLESAKAEQQIEELRSEVSYVQRLLGESRQRVTQLEELVASLRTINEAQEKAVRLAGQANTDLQHRLDVVSAEWAEQSETVRKLRIELDAAQQVPADSPELRQLRADLAEVIRERDQYRHCYDEVSSHLETIEKTAKAAAVEVIAEWLQPIRAVDNEHLANETLQHLPQIMRHLTGLTPED